MRIVAPDDSDVSPLSTPPASPRQQPVSAFRRTPTKTGSSSGWRETDNLPFQGEPSRTPDRNLTPQKALAERNTDSPRSCTRDELDFYHAVKLRQRRDPLEEYEERERHLAWQEGHMNAALKWKPVEDLLNPTRPLPASPASSPQLSEDCLASAREAQIAEVEGIFSRIQLDENRQEALRAHQRDSQRKRLWDGINAAIQAEDTRLKRIAAEKEAARLAEEERLRQVKEAEEARQRSIELEAQKKAEAEAAEMRRLQEEQERQQQQKALDEQNKRQEEAKQQQEQSVKELRPRNAREEWETYRDRLKMLKTQIMPRVRGMKQDESMINPDWRKVWSATRRSFTPKIGQVTNSMSEINRIAGLIHASLRPTPDYPQPLYAALLSSLAKAFLLQAEAEVTAKPNTAFPLAKLILILVDLGHPLLPEMFMARLVGRTGGWAVGAVVPRYEGQSDDDYRKSLGYPPATSHETSTQFIDRLVGMMTLYAAILQTPPTSPGGASVSHPFQIPRLWTLLARLVSTPQLVADRALPQVLYALIETGGDRLLEVYGRQVIKMMKTVGKRCMTEGPEEELIGGKDGKGARVRLGLLLEKWQKEGKVASTGRDIGP
ncbi:hypothetical protein FRB99_008944 [Tulasnella sp. 403]|nr:hypothetical protein FRB99_008944 [Tulasnella sp. 403]